MKRFIDTPRCFSTGSVNFSNITDETRAKLKSFEAIRLKRFPLRLEELGYIEQPIEQPIPQNSDKD